MQQPSTQKKNKKKKTSRLGLIESNYKRGWPPVSQLGVNETLPVDE